ncbi:hypothetical protein [Gracilimonas mengyeensis]|uniref:Uncharacterized protein n=1 Tax=Gracilimonas mengyeensis TaxID=1302730 RepID=A0A521ADY8_9BACT|nr:hypothetical protein [Gracilimonas mengyeensis]SMO33027.1 hypothetical protein SAMN06265219_10181 [Gracilimonas mengyeensis]
MKRLVLICFVAAFLPVTATYAQTYLQVRSQIVPPGEGYDIKEEIREMKEISALIDRFIKYTQNEDWGKAEEVKRSILVRMRDEIQHTKIKLHDEQRKAERGESLDVYVRDEDGGPERVIKNYDLKLFKQRLQDQEDIFRKLAALHLDSPSNKWKKAKEHEQLMLLFEDTLKEEIQQLKSWQ